MPLIQCNPIVDQIISNSPKGGRLGVLYDSKNESNTSYVRSLKSQACNFNVEIIDASRYNPDGSTNYAFESIRDWNNDTDIHGIIFLSPHPDHYFLIQQIDPSKRAEGNDFDDDIERVSCTARACVKIIESVTKLDGKRILIIGYGKAVGKPLSYLCMRYHVDSVVSTHKYTNQNHLFKHDMRESDIIVTAVGIPRFFGSNCGALSGKTIIDAGISTENGKIVGDIDPCLIEHNDVSPVPGGVGPVTSALLMQNVTLAAHRRPHKFA